MLVRIVLSTLLVSIISLLGIFIVYGVKRRKGFLRALISLAAGALLSVSFLDLLPEALEQGYFESRTILFMTLVSILAFFLLERTFHWHHCRCEEAGEVHRDDRKNIIYVNLIGDAIHNFLDGVLIASAFLLDTNVGWAVVLAVILHEIPQEINDFGVLLYAGLSRARAIAYNLLIALIAVGGAIGFYYYGSLVAKAIPLATAFAAGNFIYLATADLIPELHRESNSRMVIYHTLWLVAGAALMFII